MAAPCVVTGAMMTCTMGAAPGTFTGGCTKVFVTQKPAGTVSDTAMGKNIAPFGMCMSMANPAVAAATAAALGVLTPQPCTPNVAGMWTPGATKVKFESKAALLQTDQATCAFGGTIMVSNAGQTKVMAT